MADDNPFAKYATPTSSAGSESKSPSDGDNPFAKYSDKTSGTAAGEAPQDDGLLSRAGRAVAPVVRGVAPYAAGAAAGAAMGAPFAGIGAIPGAIAGAGAVGFTDLTAGIYNSGAKATGLPEITSPSEAANRGLTALGVPESKTSGARLAQSTVEGVTSALSGAGAARQLGESVVGPVAKRVATALGEGSGKQAVSGGMAGVSGQAAAEAGLGPVGQFIVSLFGGAAPYGKAAVTEAGKAAAPGKGGPKSAATEAAKAGYVLPPNQMSDTPSQLSNLLSGWGGRVKLQQAASAKNQAVTNDLAARSLGLPEGTVLTDEVFNKVRAEAGKKYEAVKNAIPAVSAYGEHGVTPAYKQFATKIEGLGGDNSQAGKYFPDLMKNAEIKTLREALIGKDAPKVFPTESAVEIVKKLRFDGNANLKTIGDPSKHALGLAQRQAADAIDDLLEKSISAQGKPEVVEQYREARKLIAKAYDVEGATNTTTGDVRARGLARLQDKGRPLSDELKTIADAASTYPKSMQSPEAFGGGEAHSVGDFFASGLALAHGNVGLAALPAARPLARGVALSKPYQAMAMRRSPMENALAPAGIPALDTYAQSENRSEVMPR